MTRTEPLQIFLNLRVVFASYPASVTLIRLSEVAVSYLAASKLSILLYNCCIIGDLLIIGEFESPIQTLTDLTQ
jgi:hypothetical protein